MNRTQNNTKTHKGSVLGKFRLLGELVIKISVFRTTEFIGSFASGPQNLSLRLPRPLVSHLLRPSLTPGYSRARGLFLRHMHLRVRSSCGVTLATVTIRRRDVLLWIIVNTKQISHFIRVSMRSTAIGKSLFLPKPQIFLNHCFSTHFYGERTIFPTPLRPRLL